jgi:hypothetical protein
LANQARRLAALLALRQPGSQQYFWCFAFRGSARKNVPQNRQLWLSARAIDALLALNTAAQRRAARRTMSRSGRKESEERRRRTGEEEDSKKLQMKIVKENRRRKTNTFKPPSSDDFQNAPDTRHLFRDRLP